MKVQFTSVWQVAPDASWELAWGLWTNTFILLYHRLLLDAWASSQERDWVPKGSIPEEPGGNCIAFHNLLSEVTASLPRWSKVNPR